MGKRRRTEGRRLAVPEQGDWLTACQLVEQGEDVLLASRYQHTPEDTAINRELIGKISIEAKDVLRLLGNMPDEVMNGLFDAARGQICQRRLAVFLKGWWSWPEIKAKTVLAELKRLTEAMV